MTLASCTTPGLVIGILHAGPRPQEFSLSRRMIDRGARVDLLDVRDIDVTVCDGYDCILNRIYTSTIFEQPRSILDRTLDVVRSLELRGTFVASGLLSTLTDHSKLLAAQVMARQSVRTPKTVVLTPDMVDRPPFLPAVVKPDVGAYGRDCTRLETIEQWRETVRRCEFTTPWICQQYAQPVGDVDYRITIVFGEVVFAYRRELANGWPQADGSSTKADVLETIDRKALELALRGSRAVGAFNNGVDLIIDERGPIIIENNPTFGFSPGSWKIDVVADKIVAFLMERALRLDSNRVR
jgi:glutathione synthase/RimK-type ligase-like ATP-grasp enzyme